MFGCSLSNKLDKMIFEDAGLRRGSLEFSRHHLEYREINREYALPNYENEEIRYLHFPKIGDYYCGIIDGELMHLDPYTYFSLNCISTNILSIKEVIYRNHILEQKRLRYKQYSSK